jgi:hypothetical protein
MNTLTLENGTIQASDEVLIKVANQEIKRLLKKLKEAECKASSDN